MEKSSTVARTAAAGDVVLCDDPSYRENLKVPSELPGRLTRLPERAAPPYFFQPSPTFHAKPARPC